MAVFETHVQADHVSGLPALVARTGALRLPSRRGGRRVRARRARRRRRGRARQHDRARDRDAGACTRPSRLPGRPTAGAARGAVARLHRRLAADRRRRPARPARRGRPRRSGAPSPRLARAAARAARRRGRLPEPLRGLGLRARRSRAIRSPRSASSAPTTRCSHSPMPDAFADALLADMPPRPAEQEAIVAANRARRVARARVSDRRPLGLRANARQFALLVGLNALVGGMVGLERSVLPLVGKQDFGLTSTSAILAFVVAFGARQGAHESRRRRARRPGRAQAAAGAGWLVALPVPLLIGLAPSWWFIVAANLLLGINQGLAWSMTVVMKIDLAGPAPARARARAQRGRRLPRRRRHRASRPARSPPATRRAPSSGSARR